jgi:hypothetical protein
MFEKARRRSSGVMFASVLLIGGSAVAGCGPASANNEQSVTTSSEPPLARAGKAFGCTMLTGPETLVQAGEIDAAVELSRGFHESPAELLADARYGIAVCQDSITGEMAERAGFVVGVEKISDTYTCVTWTAIYADKAQAESDGPTNHIGLICVPNAPAGTTA